MKILRSKLNCETSSACLLAHNGNKFDFGILQKIITTAGLKSHFQGLTKMDTLDVFKAVERKTDGFFPSKSYKLQEIYRRTFGKDLPGSHTSEGDVIAMIKCAKKMGKKFKQHLEDNHQVFMD